MQAAVISEEVGISGVQDAALVAHSVKVNMDGKPYHLLAIVIGEGFPNGALEGTALHWACSGAGNKGWQPPPHGWHTLPPISKPAGGH